MMQWEDRERLGLAKLFANIGLEGIEHLLERCEPLEIARGEHLLEPGKANDRLYLILDGELRVYLDGRQLPEQAVLTTGDCVGEMSLVDGGAVSALVIAAHGSRLLVIPHDVLWAMVDASHGVARNLLAILAGRMRDNNLALVSSQAMSLEFAQAGNVDALTGVHNRRWAQDAFARALMRCQRDGVPACLLVADVDRLSHFNARHGHLAGDAVLRLVARQLADGLRAQDLVARYGGEEFLVLLPMAGLDEALLIAERLRGLVAGQCLLETAVGLAGVTISCGVAQQRRGEELEPLLQRAKEALAKAKANGRDRVEAVAS